MSDITIEKHLFRATTTQVLSAGPLNFTTSFSTDFRLMVIFLAFSAALETAQTLKVIFDSKNGSGYDVKLLNSALSTGITDTFYQPAQDLILEDGDEIKVTLTNTGTPSITAHLTILAIQE